jgi:6-phosphogluconolactonase
MLWKNILTIAFVFLAAAPALANDEIVFFGTRNNGPTRGFYTSHFDSDTGKLTVPEFNARTDSPAYFVITPDSRHLYACNSESNFRGGTNMGGVSAFAIDTATAKLTFLNDTPSGGGDPSYITLDHTGRFVLVANYQGNRTPGEGGTVAVYALKPDGSLGERTAFDQHKGTSIDPDRQKQAYAHSIVVDPSNHFAIVDDLGLDKVFVYRFDDKTGTLTANDPPFASVKPGSGPRHTAFHPSGRVVYVIQEMGSMITAFHWDGDKGTLEKFQEISTLPSDFTGTNTAAEIRVHPSGRFLYATNRGHDSVAMFAIDPRTFELSMTGTVPSAGKTPRNFEFDPLGRWMIVTNHGSDNAVVFSIDQVTGKLTQCGDPVAVTYPFCPRFLPLTRR